MNHKTPFGPLNPPEKIEQRRIDAVHRALSWCETILTGTLWKPIFVGNNVSLQRTINGQTIEIFPLEAAYVDLGMKSRFAADHLPIVLNNLNACVRSTHSRPRPLHTDMIASMVLLLGRTEFNPAAIPRTLHSILTAEQKSSLPPPHQLANHMFLVGPQHQVENFYMNQEFQDCCVKTKTRSLPFNLKSATEHFAT